MHTDQSKGPPSDWWAALLVDGVLYQVKRRLLSAFGADHRVTFSFFFRFVFHFAHFLIVLG